MGEGTKTKLAGRGIIQNLQKIAEKRFTVEAHEKHAKKARDIAALLQMQENQSDTYSDEASAS